MKCTIKINEFQTVWAKATYNAENELRLLMYDLTDELNEFFKKQQFPKGVVHITEYHKVPPKCPNCNYELPMGLGSGSYEPARTWEYQGAVIKKAEKDFDDSCWEIILGYDGITQLV